MRIKVVSIKSYKAVKSFFFEPGENHLILLGGLNKQGKSSVLGAVNACLGGKEAETGMPIHLGENQADIEVELEDDAKELGYKVHKRFREGKTTQLKVEGRDGKVSSPQKVLDRILGGRFLDPLKFMRLNIKDQLEEFFSFVDIGIDLDEWEKERKTIFDERTGVNRDVKRFKIEVENNPDPGKIPDAVPDNLVDKVTELLEQSRKRKDCESDLEGMRKELKEHGSSIERLKLELAREEELLAEVLAKGKALKANYDQLPDVSAELEKANADLKASSALEAERNQKIAAKDRHERAVKQFAESDEKADELTAKLERMDKEKKEALEKAKMPIEGLSIQPTGLFFGKVPLCDASQAEQLAVALALSAAMSPNLDDLMVKEGAFLDEISLAQISDWALANKKRIWLERVGSNDENALIMVAGELQLKES